MKNIGIIGSGIAGLHLGLFLQKHGFDATIYSDKSPEQIRTGRIPSFVVRFEDTLERERILGVNHWDFPGFGVFGVHMYIGAGPSPITWFGSNVRPSSTVDMRIYQSTLLEDFAKRGNLHGEIIFFDELIFPDQFEQFVFRQNAVAIFD